MAASQWRFTLLLSVCFLINLNSSGVAQESLDHRLVAQSFTSKTEESLKFWLHLPEGYNESEEKFPMIVFLHGGGESGDDLEKVKIYGIPKMILAGARFPAVVIAPQNPRIQGLWDDKLVHALIQDQIEKHRIDTDRIYLTGISRGGFAVYRLAVQYPDMFAAAVIVAGGGPTPFARWCKEVPFWFFHGDYDIIVPAEEARRLVKAIKAAGGTAKYTNYHAGHHNVWDHVFTREDLYQWLFQQTRKKELPQEDEKSSTDTK